MLWQGSSKKRQTSRSSLDLIRLRVNGIAPTLSLFELIDA